MPLLTEIHVDRALSDYSLAYSPEGFIADDLAQPIMVGRLTDNFWKGDRSIFDEEQTERAMLAEANEIDWTNSTSSYEMVEHCLQAPIPDAKRVHADEVIDLEEQATRIATRKLLLKKELAIQSLLQTAANWDSGNQIGAPATLWDANGDTLSQGNSVTALKEAIQKAIGVNPNTAVISQAVLNKLKTNTSLLNQINSGQVPGAIANSQVTPELLAQLWGIDTVFVGAAVYNSADEGATRSHGYVWNNVVWMGYLEPPAVDSMSAFGNFVLESEGQSRVVDIYRKEEVKADVVRVTEWRDEVVVESLAGGTIAAVIS